MSVTQKSVIDNALASDEIEKQNYSDKTIPENIIVPKLYIEEKFKILNLDSLKQIKEDYLNENITNSVAFHSEYPSVFITTGQEPWPDDVTLYQPYEVEQILLPDMANCLSVQAYLKMCQLNFSVVYKANAEDMSPSGRVPFIKCGLCLVSDLEPIVNFVSSKGISLTDELEAVQKSDMRAYMSLVNTVLGNAENYVTWVDNETYSNVTKPRYGSFHPFPLNHILTFLKRQAITKRLNVLGWYKRSIDKVYEEVDRACSALSERLGDKRFFFGEKPCELDALVFGHIYSILTFRGYPAGIKLAEVIRKNTFLMDYCKTFMGIVGYSENIDCPMYHKSYNAVRKLEETESSDESDVDEFVYEKDHQGTL